MMLQNEWQFVFLRRPPAKSLSQAVFDSGVQLA